jgi:hypothetical protein
LAGVNTWTQPLAFEFNMMRAAPARI